MKDFPKEVIIADKVISVKVNSEQWERVKRLSKKLGDPFNCTFLVRKWIYEGLKRDEND